MPFPGTPSPFRLSRGEPSTRRNAGSQFANSPRFLLSQSIPQEKDDDVEIDDGDELPSAAPVTRTFAQPQSAIHPRRQRHAIEVSDDVDLRNDNTRGNGTHELVDDAIDSTPPGGSESPGPLDAEFDALFAPVRDSHKRRRLSAGEFQSLEEKLNRESDDLPSSPPEAQQIPRTPAPRPTTSATPKTAGIHATPSVPARPMPPALSMPGNAKTPFRSKPRFMLSARKPPTSQAPLAAGTPIATQPTSPPERRKPAFILPRSPSPNATAEDIPAPFSPSSRTLHRRGRRSGLPDYVPGGMAAEVRSWILEMGSTRESVVPSRVNADDTESSYANLNLYLVAARILDVDQTVLNSSGALAFIRAAPVSRPPDVGQNSEIVNIVAMGPPRSKPGSRQVSTPFGGRQAVPLHVGDLVGIYRGLAWEVELRQEQRWLVAMEWDLIQEAI